MKFFKLWMPVFVWCYVIYFFSDIPGLGIGWKFWDLILRKLAHIAEYFILTLLLYRAFRKSFRLSFNSIILWSSILSLMYAMSDEYHQSFISNRSGTPWDVLVDSIGVLLVVYLYIKKGNYQNEF